MADGRRLTAGLLSRPARQGILSGMRSVTIAPTLALAWLLTVPPALAGDPPKQGASASQAGTGPAANGKSLKDTPAAKPRTRTLKELIDLALGAGNEKPLAQYMERDLGFVSSLPAKVINYNSTPDGYGRILYVAYRVLPGGRLEPVALVWRAVKVTVEGTRKVFDARTFRTDLSGQLVTAAMGGGESGKVRQSRVDLDAKVRSQFQREMDFFLRDAVALEFNK